MKEMTFALATAALVGGIALSAGSVSAAPMSVRGFQTGQSGITQVRMTHGERMMMKKHVMRQKMMRRHMMKKRMMHRM